MLIKQIQRVCGFGRFPSKILMIAAVLTFGAGGSALAQSRSAMMKECVRIAKTYYRESSAPTDIQYDGQRSNGTHAISGTIYLEARSSGFSCSFIRNGSRMVEFWADGRVRNEYLPSSGGGNNGNKPNGAVGAGISTVKGIAANDVLNVRSGPGTGYKIIGALANGDKVRNLGCQNSGATRWCRVRLLDDMGGEGWVSGRYLTQGAATQLPSKPSAQPGSTSTTRVRFQAGTSGAELTGSLAPGASRRYVLGARNLQNLYFRLAARGASMSWQIFNPNGSLLDRASSERGYQGQLWQSGDYVFEVINTSNRTQSYNVIFGIR